MNPHRCTFDSHCGIVAGGMLALMCSCGRWGMSGGGEWQVVPHELLPFACRVLTKMHYAANCLRACAIALAIGFVLAWLICPEAFR